MEIWKPIANYEGYYEVSNYGNVRALYREFVGADGKVKKYHERILKPDISGRNNTSYARVTLSKNYKTKRFQVHQLVAQEFIPNPLNKPFINHIDNNGLNNNVTNLEWCTHSENMLHAQKQGRLFKAQSKGGTKGGAVNLQKALTKINALTGTQKDKWFVLGLSNTRRGNKLCLDLLCTGCNRTFIYTYDYFNNAIGTGCPKCRKPRSR